MVYYGFSFNSGNLAGDFYLNFAASGLVEIPAYLLATYLLERLVRVYLHAIDLFHNMFFCFNANKSF